MRRLTRTLIALTILITPAAGIVLTPAMAEGIAGAEAVAVLARAETADRRCNYLSSSMHDELASYSARAELAVASQISTGAARRAVATGTAEGKSAHCDDTTRSEIVQTLSAAREAVAAADSASQRKAIRSDVQDSAANALDDTRGLQSGSLVLYGKLVKSYYVERKCRHLSSNQDARYWKSIARLHRTTVAANGAQAVAPVMRQAERSAGQLSCGQESLMAVNTGFAETIRR